jgi:hypothetical protein
MKRLLHRITLPSSPVRDLTLEERQRNIEENSVKIKEYSFKKPHGRRKKLKVAVIVAILKLMSPDFWKPYSLVYHSHYLESHMNAQEK